jgi:heme-degrading monooxygenase HmoA
MAVKITLERKFKGDPFPEGLRAMNELRMKAMQQKGYVTGETLVNLEDNREVVELFIRSSLDDWKTWVNSQERRTMEDKLTLHLKGPAKIRCFMLGAGRMANASRNFLRKSEAVL